MNGFFQSYEVYKGFELVIHKFLDDKDPYKFHQECIAYKGNDVVAVEKTRKRMKELIDEGKVN